MKQKKQPKNQNEQGKRSKGRPSKYKPEYCKAIEEFFNVDAYDFVEIKSSKEYDIAGNVRKESSEKKMIPNKLPTFFRFALSIGVDVDTLTNWCKEFPDFFGAFTRAKEMQKEFLMTLGLAGVTPPAAFIFVSSNLTDMKPQGVSDYGPNTVIVPVIVRKGTERIDAPMREQVRVMTTNEVQEATTTR